MGEKENVSVNGICPICKNECHIDKEYKDKPSEDIYEYVCKQCGHFILPLNIHYLVGEQPEAYKNSGFYDDSYDRNKMIEVLKKAIEKYAYDLKDKGKFIKFCRNEEDMKNCDYKDGGIFITWDKDYNIQEIK